MATPRPLSNLIHSTGTPSSRSSTSLITPSLARLADPPLHSVDSHLVDLLTNEVIRILVHSEHAARARSKAEQEAVESELSDMGLADHSRGAKAGKKTSHGGEKEKDQDSDQADEAVRTRLDQMGFKVGWATAERLTRDRPLFPTTPSAPSTSAAPSSLPPAPVPDALEVVKFICKDVWVALYDKQVDNLRTNHRGVYVLLDGRFAPLGRVSGAEGEVGRWVRFLLAFPAGIIRGALANLGVTATVTGESAGLPQATFQIKTVKPGAI
ncbi:hypothetical protein JCM5296_006565 [Sporobolomyces johnsonii]